MIYGRIGFALLGAMLASPVLAQETVPATDAVPVPEAAPVPEPVPGYTLPTPSGRLGALRVSGNSQIEAAAVLASVQLAPGDTLTAAAIRRDLEAVWRTGYFQDIQVDLSTQGEEGEQILTFIVTENPVVRWVEITGQKKVDLEDIREVIDLDANSVLNNADLVLNQQRIRDLYLEKGYFLAVVDAEVTESEGDRVDVEFRITENRKVIVQTVDITGNENVPDRKVIRFLQTRPGGIAPWLTGAGTFRQEDLANDVHIVRSVFLEEGFVDVQVEEPKVYLSPDKRYIHVSIHVDEGLQYRLGEIRVEGDWVEEEGLVEEAALRIVAGESVEDVRGEEGGRGPLERVLGLGGAGVALESGDLFKLTDVQMVMQNLSDLFGTQGYAFANVVPLTQTRPEEGLVDITFDIAKGQKVRIGRIHISGNNPTWDKTVRREIPINEQEIYDGAALKEARSRLERLGFFEEVRITTPRATEADTLDVHIDVVEQPTGSFSIGAGFSSYESFMFTGNISKNNFLGLGYVMSAAVNWSGLRQQGTLSFADPHFLDTRWTLKVDAYSVSQQYLENQYTRGGGLAIGRYLDEREDLRLTLNYTLEDIGLTQISAYQESLFGGQLFRNGLTSSVGLNLYVDKRNNRIKPTRGLFASLSSTLSGGLPAGGDEVTPFLGGQFNLWESKANVRIYQPLTPEERIIFRLNSTLGRIQSTDGRVVPYVHRYRAGGINSVRGYNWYSLGPTIRTLGTEDPSRADDRMIVGGTETWINNIELEVPLVAAAGISGVVFFDAGNAFGDPYGDGHVNFEDLRLSYGAGIRWFSPIGPLRFELGFPIDPHEDEKPSVFDFSIGSFF